jgi:hypothetical protein
VANFYDISDWQEKPHFQTGGTRDKAIYEHPKTGDLYYFKTSLKKEVIDYKCEFWMEIIASEIGKELGFNTLQYDIACHKGITGCLSKSMIDTNVNKLSEGVNYLRGFDPNYNPDDKDSYSRYTFAFIEKALDDYRLKDSMINLVKTVIFDSLIGNGDRHQENWGFIVPNMAEPDIKKLNKSIDNKLFRLIYHILGQRKHKEYLKVLETIKGIFAPIYDSGSCLGRELSEDKVEKMLADNQMLDAYLNRDRCEIRWEDEKISHFDLLKQIKQKTVYKNTVISTIKEVSKAFNIERIKIIVENIDKFLPETLKENKLSDKRKELILKFVSLRFERLKQIL